MHRDDDWKSGHVSHDLFHQMNTAIRMPTKCTPTNAKGYPKVALGYDALKAQSLSARKPFPSPLRVQRPSPDS